MEFTYRNIWREDRGIVWLPTLITALDDKTIAATWLIWYVEVEF